MQRVKNLLNKKFGFYEKSQKKNSNPFKQIFKVDVSLYLIPIHIFTVLPNNIGFKIWKKLKLGFKIP